jgi:hypothetical protein
MNRNRLHWNSSMAPGAAPIVCNLYAHKHQVSSAPASRPWRLLWAESVDADTYVHAEGECSARYFRTMREAIAYGIRAYGETATRYPD